ncbi:MAG: TIGR03663 family protein [Chloroflexi bacterium]|nr:TIGR03663 family protein [Chloroflexota bacterium]
MSTQEPELPYGGTTGERLKAFALSDASRERIAGLAARYWEYATFALILASAAILRFYNLGARAMHHDESLHGFFSYGFTKGLRQLFTLNWPTSGFKHEPFMHGPFQFIGNGTMMAIFGDGEYQARMLAATMGTALVIMPILLRKQMGTIGAIAAALFLAFSPSLLYYSRFTREDIYTAVWNFGFVIFIWRYMTTRENRAMYLAATFMALSYATKETTFMTVVAFLLFLDFLFAHHLAEKLRAKSNGMSELQYAGLVLGMLVAGPVIALGSSFLDTWRARYELDEMPPEATLIVVLGTLALPQYAAAIQVLPGFKAWRNRPGESSAYHIADQEFRVAVTAIWALIGASIALGMLWKPKVWAIAAAFFWVPFILLYTTFFTNFAGFYSGLWGSLDYWISQQDVSRGNQPPYYYFITIPVYEFLPLALSLAAGVYYAIKGQVRNAIFIAGGLAAIIASLLLPPGPMVEKASLFHVWVPFGIVLLGIFLFQMPPLVRFLMFWLVVTTLSLTVAGEKMPWLNVHIALPLAVLAGFFVGDIVRRSDLREDLPKLERLAPFFYTGIAAALAILVFVIVGPFSLASVGGWILVVVAAVAVYWAYSGYSRKTAMQVALVGAVAAFGVFTIRAAVLSSWGHPNVSPAIMDTIAKTDYGEVPLELLVYTQTSGDIPKLRDQIDKYAQDNGLGKKTPIIVDSTDGFTWPWAWYLRDYTSVNYATVGPNFQVTTPSIILVSKTNVANLSLPPGVYGPGQAYHHRRWFPEEYRGKNGKYSTRNFFSDVFSAGKLNDWLDFWVRRTPPNDLGTVDGVAFFPKDAGTIPTEPVGPTVRTEGTQLVIGSKGFAPGQLDGPSDVALDAAGNIYVADTNNNRIQKYDPQGNFIAAVGGFTSPDVTLTQPWSMAVAPDGRVFIADTWAHKIVRLDKNLKKDKEWGGGGQVDAGGDPMKLFGPREIALTAAGNVLVSDTGNNRIIEYTADGDVVRQFGSKGSSGDPLQFSEPVSIVTNAAGDMWIADFWNKRIVKLDKDLNLKAQIQVPTWGSTGVTDRPYMALLADGRLLVTDPNPCKTAPDCATAQPGNVLVFNADGSAGPVYSMPKEAGLNIARPIGIASDGTSVVVADSSGNVVRKIPLSEVAK